tara:strand:+ start:6097 stop:6897 length:801 start_codon:yes stop_codon:yes gene_type:complete
MNNDIFKNKVVKNKQWFENSYNKKLEDLHVNNKDIGSILNYIDHDAFMNKYKTKINNKYFIVDISNISFVSFYGKTYKESIFFNIIKDIDDNFNNKDYTFKESLLYNELKGNKFTTLSEYFNLEEPNNLQKSKYYEFYPWKKNIKISPTKFCGPYSDSIINMHFIKFKRILEGLRKYGIKYNYNNMISGFFLEKDKTKKFIVNSGIHRIIIIKYLSCINKLNTNDVICQVNHTINFENINNWYHVKNKFISRINSEIIFNHLYNNI